MPSTRTMLAFVLIPLLALTTWGCASCRDHLLISVQDAESSEPVVGAKVEFRPPVAVLPPPVWRGRTDAKGELRKCVDLGEIGLGMTVLHDGKFYGRRLHSSHFVKEPIIDDIYSPDGEDFPRLRIVVQRLDP